MDDISVYSTTTAGPTDEEFDYLNLLYIIPLVIMAVFIMVLVALLVVYALRQSELWILKHCYDYCACCNCCNCCNPHLDNPDEYRHITREQDPEMYSLNELSNNSGRVDTEEMYATVIIKHDPRYPVYRQFAPRQ